VRRRLFRDGRLPGRPRGGRSGIPGADLGGGYEGPFHRPPPCGLRRRDPILALRRCGLGVPVRDPVPGCDGRVMRRTILLAAIIVLAFGAAPACGGGGAGPPSGSAKMTMT